MADTARLAERYVCNAMACSCRINHSGSFAPADVTICLEEFCSQRCAGNAGKNFSQCIRVENIAEQNVLLMRKGNTDRQKNGCVYQLMEPAGIAMFDLDTRQVLLKNTVRISALSKMVVPYEQGRRRLERS